MSEGFLWFVGLIIWLMLGGFAFAKMADAKEYKGEDSVYLFAFCVLFGPFFAGACIASPPQKHKQ